MKVVVAGAGNVGSFIANALADSGHEVVLLEKDEAVVRRLRPSAGVNVVVADSCEVSALQAAGVSDADVLVAATGDDEDNLVTSLLAKQEFATPRVIARVNHPTNEGLFNEGWGVDIAVSTPHLITGLVEEAVSTGRLVRLMQLERGAARIVEVTLDERSPVIGQAIHDLELPRQFNFVAIVRERRVVVPRGDTVFSAGDEVLALVTPESEDDVRKLLTGA